MITKLKIDGFKSLDAVSLEIKPITVLIGLNSSGKSSVLQLLALLKQSIEKNEYGLSVDGPLVSFGSFDELVSKNRIKKEIKLSLSGSRTQNLIEPFSKTTEYTYLFHVGQNQITYQDIFLKSGQIIVKDQQKIENNRRKPDAYFNDTHSRIIFEHELRLARPLKYNQVLGVQDNFDYGNLSQFLNVIRLDLEDFRLVPTIRGISCPTYPLESRTSEDLVDSSNLYSQARKFCSTIVYTGPKIEKKINKWISKITGVTIRARAVPDKNASIEANKKYEINLVNEGFGTNQLVHLFAQIAKSPQNATIGIEEPEVHLHPKAQSELAKVLIAISKEEQKNLILTTHSEHILYRILIEIAKGKIKSEDCAIYHFKLGEDGTTSVEQIKPDDKGRIKGGIPDFLENDLDEFKDFLEGIRG